MAKKCPPGVICIENITIIFLIFVLCLAGFIWYKLETKNTDNTNKFINIPIPAIPKFNSFYSTNPRNIFMNPFAPPLKNGNFFPSNSGDPRGIPININTRGFDTSYRQVGILTRSGGPEMILPLMGKPLYSSRDKWNYYTMSNENNMVKLPITYKNKSCTNEYGCDSLYNGDMVYVEGYNDTFKVTVYDNQVMRYIPYL